MTQPTLIDGVSVRMGGRDFTIPPLTLGMVKRLAPQLEKMGGADPASISGPEAADACVTVIHAALKRNYPELTQDEVEELLDLGNMQKVTHAVMGISGLIPSGEAQGEATAR
jgi:hypothetical protein